MGGGGCRRWPGAAGCVGEAMDEKALAARCGSGRCPSAAAALERVVLDGEQPGMACRPPSPTEEAPQPPRLEPQAPLGEAAPSSAPAKPPLHAVAAQSSQILLPRLTPILGEWQQHGAAAAAARAAAQAYSSVGRAHCNRRAQRRIGVLQLRSKCTYVRDRRMQGLRVRHQRRRRGLWRRGRRGWRRAAAAGSPAAAPV